MRKIYIFFVLLLGNSVYAQQRMNSSLFSFIIPMSQPGWMGTREQTEIVMGLRKQWVGWEGAPQTQYVGMSSSLFNNRIGIGINLAKDQTGARKSSEGNLVMNYKMRINSKGWKLNAGISLGFNRFIFNSSDLLVENATDINLNNYNSQPLFSLGFGCSLQSSKWSIGIFNTRLNNYLQPEAKPSKVQIVNQWNVFASKSWELNSLLKCNSAAHISYVNHGKSNIEMNGMLVYHDAFGVGLSYRYHESVGIPLQFRITPQLQILYAYDFPIQQMLSSQAGTHEIALNVQLKSKPKAVLNPRFF